MATPKRGTTSRKAPGAKPAKATKATKATPATPATTPTVDLTALDPTERLIAEHAVLAAREVRRAMDEAPHGHGLAVTENAVVEAGRRHMTLVMQEMLKIKAGTEKKTDAPVRAASGRAIGPTGR